MLKAEALKFLNSPEQNYFLIIYYLRGRPLGTAEYSVFTHANNSLWKITS